MRIVLFTHSLRSDWNHGNAHFLRGVAVELQQLGHQVDVYEPADAWSAVNLAAESGPAALDAYRASYPTLTSRLYDPGTIDLARELDGAALVLVHEWNDHGLVAEIGKYRQKHAGARVLFHDTHHRSVTDPASMAAYDLSHYDGVLAFGDSVRQQYERHGWARQVWTWHEAADTRVFHPLPEVAAERDLVWVGNWGDEERRAELQEFLIRPVAALGLTADIHGVRYPEDALRELAAAGIAYRGWLANFLAPQTFARHRVTVHVPRKPYVESLPGVPTIRVFEALACGIPLVSAPWSDTEGLFRVGDDFLMARDGTEMTECLRLLVNDREFARKQAERGLRTIMERHTCAHRAAELMKVAASLLGKPAEVAA